jgi:2-aminophenol/2-amino-5-chlorophenol 1,6-dioxygenase alpha subunit
MSGAIKGLIVPGLPHPLLAPERNEGWARIRRAFEAAREEIDACKPDLLLLYSTMWPSVIGHQIQAHPEPEWTHVDEMFHDLGSIPYRFRMDPGFAEAYCRTARERGLHARTVAYYGFPIDTGSVVALKLLNPDNDTAACIVSSNIYSDRAETLVLGKAAAETLRETGKRAVAITVTSLSNRLFTDFIDPADDRIHSPKDDEWNRKVLEFLGDGRLEDAAQLSREIHKQIRVKKVVNFKPFWWLSAVMGRHNRYEGRVHDYAPIYGAGAAVVSLTPSEAGVGDKEFDEEDVEVYRGDRSVLATADTPTETRGEESATESVEPGTSDPPAATIKTGAAPRPVGAYPHARKVGELLFVSGMGPRDPVDDSIPGGPVRDEHGNPLDYDVEAQIRATIDNVKAVLEAAGSSLDQVLDVTAFLVDMDRDFRTFNRVYAEYFAEVGATRTTLAVAALPTPIAVELKVIAAAGD